VLSDAAPERSAPIPVTVIGGYLGAGKTTLVNRLLRTADRRLAVIVNDFGELGIDAALLAGAGRDGVVDLPNGCICCTLGADFREAMAGLASRADPPDHIVIEASGVADPQQVAAWSAVPPFEPAGVVVVIAADSIRRQADDRYVGSDVRRQLDSADLLVLTKSDRCRPEHLERVDAWLRRMVPDVPVVGAVEGDVPSAVLLGARGRPGSDAPGAGILGEAAHGGDVDQRYVTWSWTSDQPVDPVELDRRIRTRPPGILRMKGTLLLADPAPSAADATAPIPAAVVQIVGRTARVSALTAPVPERSSLVAIGLRGQLRPDAVDRWAAQLAPR
jgi:G3E family GTPase